MGVTLLHWEHSYRRHGYWLGLVRYGYVGLPPRFATAKVCEYYWCYEHPGKPTVEGRTNTLKQAKNIIEDMYKRGLGVNDMEGLTVGQLKKLLNESSAMDDQPIYTRNPANNYHYEPVVGIQQEYGHLVIYDSATRVQTKEVRGKLEYEQISDPGEATI